MFREALETSNFSAFQDTKGAWNFEPAFLEFAALKLWRKQPTSCPQSPTSPQHNGFPWHASGFPAPCAGRGRDSFGRSAES